MEVAVSHYAVTFHHEQCPQQAHRVSTTANGYQQPRLVANRQSRANQSLLDFIKQNIVFHVCKFSVFYPKKPLS
jgi:hypothetical protein